MKRKWTRRKFLEVGLSGSILVGSGGVAGVTLSSAGASQQKARPSLEGLSPHQRRMLEAAMDEIIPAVDGMPAASEVGGIKYLEQLGSRSPQLRRSLEKALTALENVSRARFKKEFASLSHPQRVEALVELEKRSAVDSFATLRDFVYEAYYTQPQVWKLVGYEFHPTNESGPPMKPFDEAVLSEVRKKPKLYREVG